MENDCLLFYAVLAVFQPNICCFLHLFRYLHIMFSYGCHNDDTFSVVVVDLNAGLVGLLMTYAITLMGLFQWGVRQSAEVESQVIN